MKKLLTLIAILVSVSFAEEMDMDGRMIPTFTIPKGDTNFSFNRESEIKKITLNDSSVVIRREMAKVKNPTFKIVSVAMNGETKNYGME